MAFTTILAQKTLQPGTYDSPVEQVASTTTQVWLQAIMNTADLTDPTKSLSVAVYKSLDGTTWPTNPTVQLDWTGYAGNSRPAGFVIDGPAGGPAFWLKGRLVVNTAMSLGLQVQVT